MVIQQAGSGVLIDSMLINRSIVSGSLPFFGSFLLSFIFAPKAIRDQQSLKVYYRSIEDFIIFIRRRRIK